MIYKTERLICDNTALLTDQIWKTCNKMADNSYELVSCNIILPSALYICILIFRKNFNIDEPEKVNINV